MRLEGRDLRAGHVGDDVATLHAELERLGHAVPQKERDDRLFGVGTARAVAEFQKTRGLLDTALVDAPTAEALDLALADVGGQTAPAGDEPPTIVPTRSESVPPPRQPLGPPSLPSVQPGLAEPPKLPPVEPPKPPTKPPTKQPAEPTRAKMHGRVLLDRGLPAEGVTLRFYRRSFGGKAVRVGEVVTDARGLYTVDDLAIGDVAHLDVRAVAADGTEVALAVPGRHRGDDAAVDLVVPADRLPELATEYARLNASLAPHLDGTTLAAAREDDE